MRVRLSFAAALLLAIIAGGGAARAQGMNAQCAVTEVHGTNDKKGVDARLERFKAQLAKPPYKAWDSFTLLSEHTVTAERQKPQAVKLENGILTLLYKDKLIEEGGKARVRVAVDLVDKGGTRVISTVLVFGNATTIGGTPYRDGTYFLFLSCTAQ